jgi:hypothetical protein
MSRIDPKSTLYGHPALLVRSVLREFPFSDDGRHWKCALRHVPNEEQAQRLVADLQREELIRAFDDDDGIYFARTEKGQRIAMASARCIKRKTAEKIVIEVIQRAHGINTRPELCNRVTKLVVFGSFMNPSIDPLGDVDIGFALERKYLYGPNEPERPEEEAARDRHKGPFRNIVEQVCWPEIEVVKILKGGVAGLSLHRLGNGEDPVIFGGPHKFVFPVST